MNKLLIKFILPILLILLNFSYVEAKCKFIMDLGEEYKKSDEKEFGEFPENETGYAEVDIFAPDICSSDNFNDQFIIKHIFLEKKLMAIRFYVDNTIDNSATDSLKLMNYAKRIYGDFDTGGNPQNFNNFIIWERANKYIVYQRALNKDVWEEEIYISNDKYWDQLSRHKSLMEMGEDPDES